MAGCSQSDCEQGRHVQQVMYRASLGHEKATNADPAQKGSASRFSGQVRTAWKVDNQDSGHCVLAWWEGAGRDQDDLAGSRQYNDADSCR